MGTAIAANTYWLETGNEIAGNFVGCKLVTNCSWIALTRLPIYKSAL
jgi:hypothetical protein